jgi:plastocyanin
MPGDSWSITITGESPYAQFVPDVYTESGVPPAVLQAQIGDLICWNNQTGDAHQLVITDQDYNPGTNVAGTAPPWTSSSPGYVPQQSDVSPAVPSGTTPSYPQTIYYCCAYHPNERGTIEVIA